MHADNTPIGPDLRFEPQQIAVKDDARTVTITWGDGHVSRYPNWYLRGFCPCAVCQGHGGPLTFQTQAALAQPAADGRRGPDLTTIDEVGHYAINLTWSDGHKTGIYTLDALRNMCPCVPCQAGPLGRTLMRCLPQDLQAFLGQSS